MQVEPDRSVLAVAKRNRLLGALPDRERSAVLDGGDVTDLEYHRVLYRDSARVTTVYFPIDSVISILVEAQEGGGVEIATVGNEGVVSASALLDVSRAFGKTVVQVAGQAIAVNARHIGQLLCNEPGFSLLMHRYLYALIREIMQAGACNRMHSSEERCARWLLMTQDRAGADRFTLTQDFLAAMVGTRRATVNLVLSMFRNAGAIDYSYRTLKVLDRQQLESFSCSCYSIIRRAFEIVRL